MTPHAKFGRAALAVAIGVLLVWCCSSEVRGEQRVPLVFGITPPPKFRYGN